MRLQRRWLAAGTAAALLAGACGPGGESEPSQPEASPAEPTQPEASPAEPTSTLEQELEALGYVDFSEEVADPERSGVVRWDPARAYPGYNLFCHRGRGYAVLMDNAGEIVNAWEDPGARHWMSCDLRPGGDLVVVGMGRVEAEEVHTREVDEARYLMRLSWDGEVRWRKPMPVHHHVRGTPDGRLSVLLLRYVSRPEIDPTTPVREDLVAILDADGEVVEERSLLEAFQSNPAELRLQPVPARERRGRLQIDLIHANTIHWIDRPELRGTHPIYAEGNLLVTSRSQDTVAVIEWESNRLLWAWGQGEVEGPHGAEVVEGGNILLLDNGNKKRGWSRVVELDPRTKEIVWEYTAPEPSDFFTASRGAAQRLPNGDTLVTNSNSGQAFEVTPDGDVVWEFLNPFPTEKRRRPTFSRVRRYEESYVDAIVERMREAGSPGRG
jgi:hypothetical protein